MSWIHVDDVIGLIQFSLENSAARCPMNATSPHPVTNAEFTRDLAAALHRPAIFPVPRFALKTLFGEMAEVILGSQRVIPQATQSAGFQFQYPELKPALARLLFK
jgi:NAD dependent epimerase/dehydratase family enzyme